LPQLQNNKNSNQRSFRGDGKLLEVNRERISTAGKIGTKRYVDPCKVFIGNLPFSVTEDQLQDFVLQTMGQSSLVLHSTKIIREWKTGNSKGYGFCIFTDPIYATVCMDVVNGKELTGRLVSVSQGKKKPDEKYLVYLEQKRQRKEARLQMSTEELAIESGLDQAESNDEVDEDGVTTFRQDISDNEDDLELDALLFGMQADDDDDEDDLDGIFLERGQIYDDEDIDPNLNREQRREAARRLKRKKLPHKGFGPQLD
jgi:RNA recognition motif-containing protein